MEKNFLETVSNEYPSSFAEEKFVKADKNTKTPLVVGLIILVLVILGIIIYFTLNKKIVMKNFVGETKETLNIWIKENGINSKNIILSYEYDSEYDENIIISQSVLEGEKIKKNKVLTFTLSKGADPDEIIKFPKIKEMTYDEVKDWINENKLPNVKITQEYNKDVEKNKVVSYNLKNISESEFKRSSNLTIVVSKGEKPKGEITMENFVGKSYENVVLWAENNKINLTINEVFSNKQVGEVIYQSVAADTKITQDSSLTINVSKGSSIIVPNLINQSKVNVEAWSYDKDINIIYNEVYSDSYDKNRVISQSALPNSEVGEKETIILTLSLGKPYLANYKGQSINDLLEWVEEVNEKGGNIKLVINEKSYYSETVPANGIINQNKTGYIGLNDSILVTLSLGSKILVDMDYIGTDEETIKNFCYNLNCVYEYKKSNLPIGTVTDIKINNQTLRPDMYINSSDMILVTISEGA